MKKRIFSILLAVVMLLGMIPGTALTAFAAEPTTITSVTATSDVGQPVYGAQVPGMNVNVFTITSGSPAFNGTGVWRKWDGSQWQQMGSYTDTFTEGTWRYEVQIREESSDHILSNPSTFTVNGVEWTCGNQYFSSGKYSWNWFYSPEYTVTAPVLEYYDVTLNSGTGYTVEKVTGSESPVVAGGSFTFKVTINSGYEEGSKFKVTVNGTAVNLDGEGKYTIANINEPQNVTVEGVIAKRTAIDSIVATTTFNPVYGATVADPTFNVTTGSPATFNTDNNQGAWYKWNGSSWEEVSSGTFTVGRWRYEVQIRTDSTTHKLGESVTVTVNGNAWSKKGSVAYGDSFSYVYFVSPEFTVENPNAREITFAANGGGSTMASVIVEVGDTYELPACGFTAPAQGQEFKYWDVDGARKNPGDVITITDNTTVKAVWGLKEYTVNFTGDTAYYSEDDDDNKATHGQNYVVKFTPVDGYEIDNGNLVIHSGSNNLMNIPGSWNFDDATDTLTIVGTYVTGDLTISVAPDKIPGKFNVTWTNGTGYQITAAEGYSSPVTEGNDFHFVVTLGGNYKEGANFKVKANGVELTKVGGGYVIENITANQEITVEGVVDKPTYTVTLPTGTGYTSAPAGTFTTTVVEGNNFSFVVTLGGNYREGANFKVKANGVELTKVGGGYTIENITANQVITVEGVEELPKYTVTWNDDTGYQITAATGYTSPVYEGEDFHFVVTLDGNYREGANFKVKANGVELTKVGGGYAIENITANTVITVEDVEELPKYNVTWTNGTGYQITAATGYTSPVYEGEDFHFVVTLDGNYREGANYKVKANGVELTKIGGGYAIENITANTVITVEDVEELPKYNVTWTNGTGYQITAATGYTSPVYEGEDFHFVVTLDGNYREGANYKVKANGVELTKIGGGYVIENITANTVITVEDVEELPKYTVTWTDGTGYQITAATGYTSPVYEDEDFHFVVTLGGNYQEGANYKVKANGVELTKVGGGYAIENITANTVITVEGVEQIPANDDNNGNTDNKPSDTPQTGDNSNMILWISLLMLSALGVVATTIIGKKRYSVK